MVVPVPDPALFIFCSNKYLQRAIVSMHFLYYSAVLALFIVAAVAVVEVTMAAVVVVVVTSDGGCFCS